MFHCPGWLLRVLGRQPLDTVVKDGVAPQLRFLSKGVQALVTRGKIKMPSFTRARLAGEGATQLPKLEGRHFSRDTLRMQVAAHIITAALTGEVTDRV